MKERYEQEIEQLLIELESRPPDDTNAPPASAPRPPQTPPTTAASEGAAMPLDDLPSASPFTPRPRRGVRLIAPSKLALAGLIIAVLGLVLPVPLGVSLAGLAILGLAVAWLMARRMMSRPGPAAGYWRGRPLAPEPPPRGAWQRFRQWLAQ